ncbi:MAG: hypothetical protein K8T90_06905 [Planctomycetes bacterium]|nr:hypothetical protein [Planctomycetota bacterium]
MTPNTQLAMKPRTRLILTVAAAAVIGGVVSVALLPTGVARAADVKVPDDANLKAVIKKLYSKVDFEDSIGRTAAVEELNGILGKAKDKKNSALKYTGWWSDQIREAIYAGDKLVKVPGKTKDIAKTEVELFPNGDDKPSGKVTIAYRGPSAYSKGKPTPMLISLVDAKTDPEAYLAKSWVGIADMAKEWILVCVAESDVFDVTKDKAAVSRVASRMMHMYNVDPNRIFLEGVGPSCKSAEISASLSMPDRLAGLVLRNPGESPITDNLNLFTTVVVKGPEGNEKATAVFAKVKAALGEEHAVELTTADVASVDGQCQGLADWLKAAKPRETPRNFTWTATFDKDNLCPNVVAGNVWIISPTKREEATKLKVTFSRDTNTVDIQATNLGEYSVLMNDDLLDLDKEVAIFVNGTLAVKKVFDRKVQEMIARADDFFEWGILYPAQYRNYVATQIAAPVKKDGDGKDAPAPGGGDKK